MVCYSEYKHNLNTKKKKKKRRAKVSTYIYFLMQINIIGQGFSGISDWMRGGKRASEWAEVLTKAQSRSTASRISSWWPTRVIVSSSRSWWEIFRSCSPLIFSLSKLGTYCWRLSSSPETDRKWAWETQHKETLSGRVCGSSCVLTQQASANIDVRHLH